METVENSDSLVDEIDTGALRPSMHGVIRAIYVKLTEPLEDQRRLVHDLEHESEVSRHAWAERLWAKIDGLPLEKQGPLRMMIGLTQDDTILNGYEAEYFIDWARAQGLSEEQIVSASRAAQTVR